MLSIIKHREYKLNEDKESRTLVTVEFRSL